MSISIFEVTGPVMVGPSSSHTAGAAKLSRMAAMIVGEPFYRVEFGLYGSFAKTYRGHGTDLALVAGVLGIKESDERLAHSFDIAKEKGLQYSFKNVELKDVGENTAQMRFFLKSGMIREIIGSSLGGGRICICRIDGFETEIYCEKPSVMILHRDQKGMLSRITAEMAKRDLNIAILRCTRLQKGDMACTIIESDEVIPMSIKQSLEEIQGIRSVCVISPEEVEE
jgi:L-serine dehydratase